MEQKDRSLTVMIPRAKYHPLSQPPQSSSIVAAAEVINDSRYNLESYDKHAATASVCSTTEAKLLSYLDASPSAAKVVSL